MQIRLCCIDMTICIKAVSTTKKAGLIKMSAGNPNVNDCMKNPFFGYYVSYESEAIWNAIYTNAEIQGYFAESWAAVATALKGSPGLLGYELL